MINLLLCFLAAPVGYVVGVVLADLLRDLIDGRRYRAGGGRYPRSPGPHP